MYVRKVTLSFKFILWSLINWRIFIAKLQLLLITSKIAWFQNKEYQIKSSQDDFIKHASFHLLQGVPLTSLTFKHPITQKRCTFDPCWKAKMSFGGVNSFQCLNCLFAILEMNLYLSNAFWLYHHGVKNAYFQNYKLL